MKFQGQVQADRGFFLGRGGGYPLTIPAQNNTYIIFSKLLKREISMVNISTYLPLYSNQQKPYN